MTRDDASQPWINTPVDDEFDWGEPIAIGTGWSDESWGDDLAEAGLLDAAIEAYELAVSKHPDDEAVRSKLEALKSTEPLTGPMETVSTVRSYEEAYEYGRAATRSRRYNLAIAALDAATRLRPSSPYAWCSLAAAHRRAGHTGTAIEYYEKSLEFGGGDPALTGLGAAYRSVGETTKAISLYEDVLTREPENPYALNGLAGVYYDLGRNAESEQCFRRAAANADGIKDASEGLRKLRDRYVADGDQEGANRVASLLAGLGQSAAAPPPQTKQAIDPGMEEEIPY